MVGCGVIGGVVTGEMLVRKIPRGKTVFWR